MWYSPAYVGRVTFWRDLLSKQVAREFKPYREILRRRKPLLEQLSMRKVFPLVFFLPVALSLVAAASCLILPGALIGSDNPDDAAKELASVSKAVGAILASLSAILITILVFALEIRRSDIPGGAPLLRLYATRRGYLPTAAFVLGTIGSTIMAAALGPYLGLAVLERVVWAVSTLAFGCVLLELVLVYVTIQSLEGESARSLLADYFKVRHRDSLEAEIRRRLSVNLFIGRVRSLGFNCNVFMAHGPEQHYAIRGKGRIVDVDFGPLKTLAGRWDLRSFPEEQDSLGGWDVADVVTPSPPVFTVLPYKKLDDRKATTVLVFDRPTRDLEAESYLEQAFVCRNRGVLAPEVQWADYCQMLKALARQRDSKGLEDGLLAFEETVEDYLRALTEIGEKHEDNPFSRAYTPYLPPTPHSIEFRELVEVTLKDGDRACLDALSMSATRLAKVAFGEGTPEYFMEALVALYQIYRLGQDSEQFAESVSRSTVDRLRMIAQDILGLHVFAESDTLAAVEHVRPYVQRLLDICLSLLRLAAERGDEAFFGKLTDNLDDLLEHLKAHRDVGQDTRSEYDHLLFNIRMAEEPGATEEHRAELARKGALHEAYLAISDLQHLVALVTAAWCIDLVRVKKLTSDQAKPLAERALRSAGDFREVVETCLFMAADWHRDDGLGYEHWDHEELVPGKSRTRWGTAWENWVKNGWVVAALRAAAATTELDPRSIRLLHGIREHGYKELAASVDAVLKNRARYDWLLGQLDLDAAKQKLLEVLSALRDRQEVQDRAELAQEEISPEKVAAFARKCAEAYKSSRSFASLVRRFGGEVAAEPAFCPIRPPSTMFLVRFPDDKGDFIESPYDSCSCSDVYARKVGSLESVRSAYWIENNLRKAGVIPGFADLVSAVRQAAGDIRNAGFEPTVVMIPSDWRYEGAITDVPDWQRQSPFEEEPFPEWVGQIDEMHVFAWPHDNAKSVAVLDIGRLISWRETIHTDGTPLKVEIDLPTEKDVRSWLSVQNADERQRREKDLQYAGDLETLRRTKVVGMLYADVLLGITEPRAGARLTPNTEAMGVVYEEGGDTFHLPECEAVKAISKDNRRFCETPGVARSEKELKPCSDCRPSFPPR